MAAGDVMTVFEKWQSYERTIVPAGAGAQQREACRRAFYAGAVAIYGLVTALPEDEDDAMSYLEDLKNELYGMVTDLRVR